MQSRAGRLVKRPPGLVRGAAPQQAALNCRFLNCRCLFGSSAGPHSSLAFRSQEHFGASMAAARADEPRSQVAKLRLSTEPADEIEQVACRPGAAIPAFKNRREVKLRDLAQRIGVAILRAEHQAGTHQRISHGSGFIRRLEQTKNKTELVNLC
jgi:hypothetical protein